MIENDIKKSLWTKIKYQEAVIDFDGDEVTYSGDFPAVESVMPPLMREVFQRYKEKS